MWLVGASTHLAFSKSLSYQKLIFKFTLYSVVQYYCFALFITINNKYFVIIFKLPNYQTTKLPNYQTTKLPNYQTTKLPNYQTTKLPNYQTTKLLTYLDL
ncbi:hypothetical protein CIK00_01870 [Photobacterium carnosum]|uniref:Transmembrane protein n=1 Tax=Photobacterium carnosum TaxID=2023717 RepID=A0A2N4UXN4_9GAMM|nr:hypothetical protein CIK00_01870 [Photobacterium carnosum]